MELIFNDWLILTLKIQIEGTEKKTDRQAKNVGECENCRLKRRLKRRPNVKNETNHFRITCALWCSALLKCKLNMK